MNDMSVKPTNILDPQAGKSQKGASATAVAGLATSFKDLVSKVGINFDTGLSDISGKSGITAVGDNLPTHARADDHAADARDDGRDRPVERGAEDRPERDRSEPQRAEHRDTETRDDNPAHRDDNRGDNRDSHDTGRDDHAADKPAHADKPARDDRQGGDDSAAGDTGASEAKSAAGQDGGNKGGAETGNGAQNGNAQNAQALAAQAAANAALDAGAVINAVGSAVKGEQAQTADTAKANTQQALAGAGAQNQKQAGVHAASTNTGQHQGQGAQNQNANTAANIQAADQNTRANTTLQQQTAQLAQALGQDAKVKVNVAVTQESETLTSRPNATLSAATALAGDNKGQARTGPQTTNHAAANAQNAAQQAAGQQAMAGQAQAQQAAAQGGTGQAGVQAGSAATTAQNGPAGVHAAGPTTGGGEQANPANSANAGNGPQQAQQSQQTQQAAQTARPHQPLQSSVAEQVSVNISKALQNGQDKITIRLNPAELGRVEVKMELTHDGRATAVVTADNRETLDLLRRDSSELQKALQEGGLQLSDADLNFNLRGEEGQTAEDGDGSSSAGNDEDDLADGSDSTEPEIMLAHEGGVLVNGRLDVRA